MTDAPAPVLAEPANPGPAAARPARWRPARRWLAAAGWAAAALLVFAVYLRVSQTEPGDSYGAVFTLQAWDMLHGNLLLHGWWLSDVSFYTTELPEYLLVELVLGRSPDVVHVAGAITFTLVLLLAMALAQGRPPAARPRSGWPSRPGSCAPRSPARACSCSCSRRTTTAARCRSWWPC